METRDDIHLAVLELEGLLGKRPVPLSQANGVGSLSGAAIAAGIPEDHLLAGAVPVGVEPELVRRLGMISQYFVQDGGTTRSVVMHQTEYEFGAGATGKAATTAAGGSRRKNEYLTHNWHKYKAKFFPRMARALINATTPNGVVGDPFVGSGTLNVEASLMGLASVGLDIDPLSVEISNCKQLGLTVDVNVADKALRHLQDSLQVFGSGSLFNEVDLREDIMPGTATLPEFIGRKLDRPVRDDIEADLFRLRSIIAAHPDETGRRLLKLALSHALATKVSLRWMGTGDNRFALSIAVRSLDRIMLAHMAKLVGGVEQRDRLIGTGALEPGMLGRADISLGDARSILWADESLAGVVTSPPYLPAASGRETYLRSRACSLTGTGLLTEQEILTRETEMVGSILRGADPASRGLPPSVRELVEWMLPQRARKPKALPTAAYFLDIAASLKEIGRVLQSGGRLAMVLSAEHVFYDLVSRNIVRVLDMPAIVEQLIADPVNEIPLRIDEVVRIQLPKMDYAARPASKGNYSEAILIAQKT
ncbi:DNA methyltransferase [Geodermatophilus sp. SYSU D00708]